jgi:hypothetical protein
MPERTGREFAEAFAAMLSAHELDRLHELLQPDCVQEYPQSGERFSGIESIRGVYENYPGGIGQSDVSSLRVAGGEDRWAMAPNFTVIKTTGAGNSYSSAVKARYPDGSDWYVITMFDLVDGRMAHGTVFFAPVFEAPEWRKAFADDGAAAGPLAEGRGAPS